MFKIPLGNSVINQAHANKKGSAGILFKKDLHLAEFQRSNHQLRQQLSIEMNRFQILTKQQSITSSREKQLQTLINLAQIESLFSFKQIERTNKQAISISLALNQLKEKTLETNSEVQQLAQKVQLLFANSSETEKSIKRYKEQLRNDEILLKSEKNLTNIRNNLTYSHQNYQKHINILLQKLESKNKYLAILEKKIKTKGKAQKQSTSKTIDSEFVVNRTSQKFHSNGVNRSKQQIKNDKIEKDDRNEIKKMNQLIRKKNSLLLKKK